MPSIDLTNYTDLSVFDKTAEEIIVDSLDYAKTALPTWIPTPGSLEVVLMEALAVQSSEVVASINRLPSATTETVLKLYGLSRGEGAQATADIDVVMTDSLGHSVPAGTLFAYYPPNNADPLVYSLDNDIVVGSGFSTASGTITAITSGISYNTPANGAGLFVTSTTPFLNSATFGSQPTGGAGIETESIFLDRGINYLASLSSSLTTASQITAFVVDGYTQVFRVKSYDKAVSTDRDTTAVGYGVHPGYVLVVVAGENADPGTLTDIPIASGTRIAVAEAVMAKTNASLIVEVEDPQVVGIGVTSTFGILPGYVGATVSASVEEALDDYLSANNWDWSSVVRVNEVVALIDGITGVDYVTSVTLATNAPSVTTVESNGDVTMHVLGSLTTPTAHSLTAV